MPTDDPPSDSVLSDSDRPPRTNGPPSDSLTIVVHLPQHFAKVVALLDTLGRQWPDVSIDGFARIEIPADDE